MAISFLQKDFKCPYTFTKNYTPYCCDKCYNAFKGMDFSKDPNVCEKKTFFCEGRSVLQTNIVNNCLGSLYLGSSTLIKSNCKFRIATTREKIYSLKNNRWLVYSIGTIATNQVCSKTNTLIANHHQIRTTNQNSRWLQHPDHGPPDFR